MKTSVKWTSTVDRRPCSSWRFQLVDVDHWRFQLVDVDHPDVLLLVDVDHSHRADSVWSTSTILTFSSGRRRPDWCFSTGRRRPLTFSTGRRLDVDSQRCRRCRRPFFWRFHHALFIFDFFYFQFFFVFRWYLTVLTGQKFWKAVLHLGGMESVILERSTNETRLICDKGDLGH